MAIVALDRNTVKFLTTAQVVTSVSTAVKELVENAIDARATSVEIKLEDNGASLIEVADNGNGISEIDAAFVGLQSYTSKITDFSDLDSLESYGFRGEALSSLCRVAEVTIITKTEADVAARLYRMNHDGSVKNFELSHRAAGTTIQARFMFKDFPVRRQILANGKRAIQDVKVLENLLRSFGICHPQLRISYRVNGSVVFGKSATESLRESLASLYGRKFVSQMDFLEIKSPEVDAKLTLPKRDSTELSEICLSGQHIFVNQRPVSYKEIEKVINQRLVDYFGEKIPAKKKLAFFLSLKVPAAEVDVNLEPNKTCVILANRGKIVKKLEEVVVKFYGIDSRAEDSLLDEKSLAAGNDSTVEYHDISMGEIKNSDNLEFPSAKKRKIEGSKTGRDFVSRNSSAVKKAPGVPGRETPKSNRTAKKLFQTPGNKFDDSERKKLVSNSPKTDATPRDWDVEIAAETISQMLVVDLGEDFNTQEIEDLPNLDAKQVESILGRSANEQSLATINLDNKPVITEEEWSKGRVPINIRGGTDVRIYNNALKDSIHEPETTVDDSNSTACKGFAKFSKEMRPQIITENPGINFVQTATLLTGRWKELSPEERGYYRDLAAEDEHSHDTSIESRKSVKRRISNDEAESNRKRFLSMLDKMKHARPAATANAKLMMRTVIPWNVNLKSVTNSFVENTSKVNSRDSSIVLGSLADENLWLVRTGVQIWALSLRQLFDGLGIEKSDEKTNTRETIEELMARWMSEKEGLSLLHPVFELG